MMRRSAATVLSAALCAVAAEAADLDARLGTQEVPYAIARAPLRDVIRDFGGNFGLAVAAAPGVEGTVVSLRGRYTPSGFLDALSTRHGIVWYFDGHSIHVSPAGSMRSILIDTAALELEAVVDGLEELGVWDDRYPITRTDMTEIGLLTGPPRYVELVENAFQMLTAEAEASGTEHRAGDPSPEVVVIRARAVTIWRGAKETAPETVDPMVPNPVTLAPAAKEASPTD